MTSPIAWFISSSDRPPPEKARAAATHAGFTLECVAKENVRDRADSPALIVLHEADASAAESIIPSLPGDAPLLIVAHRDSDHSYAIDGCRDYDIAEEDCPEALLRWRINRLADAREELQPPLPANGISQRDLSRRLASIANLTPDLIGIANLDGEHLYINPAGRILMGIGADEDLGELPIAKAHPKHVRKRIKDVSIPCALAHGVWSGESCIKDRQTGKDVPVWQVLLAPRDANGKPTYFATFMRDLRELRALQESLRAAEFERERAQEADLAKSRFLASMSHEIRTPLNAVLGYSQLLGGESMTDKQHRYVGHIQKSGRVLLDLIDEILDLARIEAGAMSIVLEPIRAATALSNIVKPFRNTAEARGLEFRMNLSGLGERVVEVDPRRLTQIVGNLVENAVTFTDAGSVVVDATIERDQLHVTIADTGPGMTDEEIDQSTDAFHRGVVGQGPQGIGLGLPIARALLEQLQGQLTLTRGNPTGLIARVTIPVSVNQEIHTVSDVAGTPTESDALPSKTVLVVDDEEANRMVLREMLMPMGMNVLLAESGNQAVKMYCEAKPEVVLLDMLLPGMSGPETLRVMRESLPEHKATVFAVTADLVGASRLDTGEDGFQEVLIKPIQLNRMVALLSKHLSTGVEARGESRDATAGATKCDPRAHALPKQLVEGLLEAIELQRVSRIRSLVQSVDVQPDTPADEAIRHVQRLLRSYAFDDLEAWLRSTSDPSTSRGTAHAARFP